ACRNMMPLVASRMDWPVSRIVLILQEAGEAGSQSVRDTLSAAHTNHMPRLMHIAAALRIQVPTERLLEILQQGEEEMLIVGLKLASDPRLLPAICACTSHPEWRVRLRSAIALGRLASRAHVDILVGLLSDKEWWVRYRAAQAIISLPFLGHAEIQRMTASLSDRFAKDIMTHVMTEMRSA